MWPFSPRIHSLPILETNDRLVLKKPKHYHASGYAYDDLSRDQKTFIWSTYWDDLIGNDLMVIAEGARQHSHRRYVHVSAWRICSEQHSTPN